MVLNYYEIFNRKIKMDDRKELQIKSMEFCQGNISIMAKNSSTLKAWFLVAFAALFTFFAKSVSGETSYNAALTDIIWILPMLVFPLLDAFYLKQERMFIDVYNDFEESLNGTEDTRQPFNLKPSKQQREKYNLLNVVFSMSIGWFYFPLLIAFQALIIFYSQLKCWYLWILLFPFIVVVMTFIFKKKTDHQRVN